MRKLVVLILIVSFYLVLITNRSNPLWPFSGGAGASWFWTPSIEKRDGLRIIRGRTDMSLPEGYSVDTNNLVRFDSPFGDRPVCQCMTDGGEVDGMFPVCSIDSADPEKVQLSQGRIAFICIGS